MPTYTFGTASGNYLTAHTLTSSSGASSSANRWIRSDGYTFGTARAAANGKNPITVYQYHVYTVEAFTTTPKIHGATTPDVTGTQTSGSVTTTGGQIVTESTLGGVAGFYSDTPYSGVGFILTGENTDFYTEATGSGTWKNGSGVTGNGMIIWSADYYQSPTAPQSAKATASTTQAGAITITWSAPSDTGGTGITGYRIIRDGTTTFDTTSSGSFTDTGLSYGSTHSYVVYAKNSVTDLAATTSVGSSTVSATALGPSTAPQSFSVSANSSVQGRIDLSWSAPSNTGGGSSLSYDVYQDGTLVSNNQTGTTFTASGLSVWSSHSYYVTAVTSWGNGSSTSTLSATAPGVPTAPINLTATASTNVSGRVNLAWTAPSNTAGGLTGYNIYISGSLVAQVSGTTLSYTDDGQTPGTSYSYTVTARNAWADGNSITSPSSNVATVTAGGPPTAPQSLIATASKNVFGRVDLSWTAPSNPGGTVNFYSVYVDGSSTVSGTAPGNTPSYTVTGLSQNVSHTFVVRARNAWLDASGLALTTAPASNTATATAGGPPSAPLNFTVTANQTIAGRIDLSWTAPTTVGSGITRYSIRNADGSLVADTTATSYSIVGTSPGQYYSYNVVAWDAIADAAGTPGPATPTLSAQSLGSANAPTNLLATPSTTLAGRITLTWIAPAGVITGYTIYRDGAQIAFVNTVTYQDIGLTPGVSHSYYVTAANAATSAGTPSATVTASAGEVTSINLAASTVTNKTNVALSGTYNITSIPTSKQLSYAFSSSISVPAGTSVPATSGKIVDQSNVEINGPVFINTVAATNQITYNTPATTISPTATPAGTATDNTNLAMTGKGLTISAIDAANSNITYTAPGTAPSTTAAVPASGTVADKTNEVFNGNFTISGVTEDTVTFTKPNSSTTNVALLGASGTIVDSTNSDFFNGDYTVSATPAPNQFQYVRVPSNLSATVTNLVTNPGMEAAGTSAVYRTNYCINPNFETGIANWDFSSTNLTPTQSATNPYIGTSSALLTMIGTASSNFTFTRTDYIVGQTYTLSMYMRSGGGDTRPVLTVVGGTSTTPIVLTTDWIRHSITFVATATSHTIGVNTGTATIANSSFYIDAVLLERSPLLLPYFDGGSSADADFTYSWDTTAGSSRSYQNAIRPAGVTFTADNTGGLDYAKGYRTSVSPIDGTYSLTVVNRGAHTDQYADITGLVALAANTTYAYRATVRTTESVTDSKQIHLVVAGTPTYSPVSTIVGPAGTYTITGTFTTTGFPAGGYVRLYNSINRPGSTVIWDDLMIIKTSATDIPYFSGDTPNTGLTAYTWSGAANASTSTRTTTLVTTDKDILDPFGITYRTDSPASVEIKYRSGWLG